MRAILVLALCVCAVAALPSNLQGKGAKISGGSLTTISQYPSIVSLSYSWNSNAFWHTCVGVIINRRSVLATAKCIAGDAVNKWRVRMGSTFANSGGTSSAVSFMTIHPDYNGRTYDNDLAILRTVYPMSFYEDVLPGSFANQDLIDPDNVVVTIPGWGVVNYGGGLPSEQLRVVDVPIVNQDFCVERLLLLNTIVNDNMLCSGWIDNSNRGQCPGDEGSPLYHNDIIVGIYSWSPKCGDYYYPSINIRIPRYIIWINDNA